VPWRPAMRPVVGVVMVVLLLLPLAAAAAAQAVLALLLAATAARLHRRASTQGTLTHPPVLNLRARWARCEEHWRPARRRFTCARQCQPAAPTRCRASMACVLRGVLATSRETASATAAGASLGAPRQGGPRRGTWEAWWLVGGVRCGGVPAGGACGPGCCGAAARGWCCPEGPAGGARPAPRSPACGACCRESGGRPSEADVDAGAGVAGGGAGPAAVAGVPPAGGWLPACGAGAAVAAAPAAAASIHVLKSERESGRAELGQLPPSLQ
jgi:hypothetical protein